jgi:hypothetical protein
MTKKRFIYLFLILSIVTVPTAYGLFTDSVSLTTDLKIKIAEIDFEIKKLNHVPVQANNLAKEEWSKEGKIKITNESEGPLIFTFYINDADDPFCENVEIEINAFAEEGDSYIDVFSGKITELAGENNKITLNTENVEPDKSWFIVQNVRYITDVEDKANCSWEEVIRGQFSENMYAEESIGNNKLQVAKDK